MLEDLRETVLTDLEQRVARAIGLIDQLKQDKLTLESQIRELQEQIQVKDEYIESLEKRNAELQYAESELAAIRAQQEQEREDVDLEKAELRDRLEGVMRLLNGADDSLESSPEQPPAAADESIEKSETAENDGTDVVPESVLDSETVAAEDVEASAEADEPIAESSESSFAGDESPVVPESIADEETDEALDSPLNPETAVAEETVATAGADEPIVESSESSFAEDESPVVPESIEDEDTDEIPDFPPVSDAAAAEGIDATARVDESITESSDLSFDDDETTEPPLLPDEQSSSTSESSPDADAPVTEEDAQTETERHAINSPWE